MFSSFLGSNILNVLSSTWKGFIVCVCVCWSEHTSDPRADLFMLFYCCFSDFLVLFTTAAFFILIKWGCVLFFTRSSLEKYSTAAFLEADSANMISLSNPLLAIVIGSRSNHRKVFRKNCSPFWVEILVKYILKFMFNWSINACFEFYFLMINLFSLMN